MLSLIGQNWTHFLWALIATIMMVIIGFLTPLLLSEIVDSILGSEPFTMPDFLMNPINALGGRDFLRQNLWIPALALILMNVVNGVFTFIKGLPRLRVKISPANCAMTSIATCSTCRLRTTLKRRRAS